MGWGDRIGGGGWVHGKLSGSSTARLVEKTRKNEKEGKPHTTNRERKNGTTRPKKAVRTVRGRLQCLSRRPGGRRKRQTGMNCRDERGGKKLQVPPNIQNGF